MPCKICGKQIWKTKLCRGCYYDWMHSAERHASVLNESSRSLAQADFIRRCLAEDRAASEVKLAAEQRAAKEKRPQNG